MAGERCHLGLSISLGAVRADLSAAASQLGREARAAKVIPAAGAHEIIRGSLLGVVFVPRLHDTPCPRHHPGRVSHCRLFTFTLPSGGVSAEHVIDAAAAGGFYLQYNGAAAAACTFTLSPLILVVQVNEG